MIARSRSSSEMFQAPGKIASRWKTCGYPSPMSTSVSARNSISRTGPSKRPYKNLNPQVSRRARNPPLGTHLFSAKPPQHSSMSLSRTLRLSWARRSKISSIRGLYCRKVPIFNLLRRLSSKVSRKRMSMPH
jgi:hypothetical protein